MSNAIKTVTLQARPGMYEYILPNKEKVRIHLSTESAMRSVSFQYLEDDQEVVVTKSMIVNSIAKIAKEKASRRGAKLSFFGPNGKEGIDSMVGVELILENMKEFLKELGFK